MSAAAPAVVTPDRVSILADIRARAQADADRCTGPMREEYLRIVQETAIVEARTRTPEPDKAP